MDYKYEKLIDDLKEQRKISNYHLGLAKEEMKKHEDVMSTDDKFEVRLYNYWRGVINETEKNISFINLILEEQEELMKEDIREIEEAEEFEKELRYEAGMGI